MDRMAQDDGYNGDVQEEIVAAPALLSDSEVQARRQAATVTVNRYLYLQAQQFENMLLDAEELQEIFEVLLVSLPRHFNFCAAELWLFDPEGVLADLISGGQRYGHYLQLQTDSFAMQELYDLDPDVLLVDGTDPRMFEVLRSERGVESALLLPLMESGRMIGSLHLGLDEDSLEFRKPEEDLMAHLAMIISSVFKNAIMRQQVSRLTLLDPLTQISNLRGFEKDITREISRARRADTPVSVLVMDIDDYDDLHDSYGDRRAQFVVKKVTERISSDLRQTDMLARLSRSRFAVLIPGSGEMLARDIAERMRKDIDAFSIDDGQGAVLEVTLSFGVVTWEPQQYPAVDMPHLAKQMETVAVKALNTAKSRGGNQIALSRLATLMV